MADQPEMLCEKCREHIATFHITNFVDGRTETKNLCVGCVQNDPSFASLSRRPNLHDLIRTGKCNYCGAPPISGSQSGGDGGPDQVHLYCAQCGKDLEEFAAKPENQWDVPEIDDSLDNDAFLAELDRIADEGRKIDERRQEFMRMKVAQRRSGPK